MVYDNIIIGGGIAGYVCAYEFGKKGKSCLILEKNEKQSEKVCGGGISYKALSMLENMGISSDELFFKNCCKIYGHIIHNGNRTITKKYKENKVSLGIQRKIFDEYLLDNALLFNNEIKFGSKVTNIVQKDDLYEINGNLAKNYIWAIGARRPNVNIPTGQSLGMSAIIKGNFEIDNRYFHYWYDTDFKKRYFWVFPIGIDLWNVGVWYRYPDSTIKAYYDTKLQVHFLSKSNKLFNYIFRPRSEFLGHVDQRNNQNNMSNGIGDFAGKCNPVNGGGIIYAIKSAVDYSNDLV